LNDLTGHMGELAIIGELEFADAALDLDWVRGQRHASVFGLRRRGSLRKK
jgi:hypothetical protein